EVPSAQARPQLFEDFRQGDDVEAQGGQALLRLQRVGQGGDARVLGMQRLADVEQDGIHALSVHGCSTAVYLIRPYFFPNFSSTARVASNCSRECDRLTVKRMRPSSMPTAG